MADGAGDDVGGHRQREAEAEHAAEDQRRGPEPVEPAPFEVTLALHQQFVGDGHHYPRRPGESRDPYPQLRVVKASWRLSCPNSAAAYGSRLSPGRRGGNGTRPS